MQSKQWGTLHYFKLFIFAQRLYKCQKTKQHQQKSK